MPRVQAAKLELEVVDRQCRFLDEFALRCLDD
jgi:hypothetical protein